MCAFTIVTNFIFTVFCNCDDPYWSDFFYYFVANFNALGLKKLIATHYIDNDITL
ncbi:adenine-specific methyltransferase EcoRI family protein, partial [Treponema endosymbiont of Eucomonympha sp.]|uniref:adenine-specific methyltransferase EcoRI family protein n=1 Tax=Treponema endosymbiont of Eucomonympha sp. TaxID=1580831 RepID=UPI0035A0A30A